MIRSKKGIILILSLLVLSVVMILTSIYFSGLITERKSSETERGGLQALDFAEAAANQGVAELRKRIRVDLKARVALVTNGLTIRNYVTNNDPLGFLANYAYASGQPQFTVSAGVASVGISPLSLNSLVPGNFSATINVTAAGAPVNPTNEVYVFQYNYWIDASGNVNTGVLNVNRQIRLSDGSFSITVRRDNFAKFALFTVHHRTPSGTTVWFTANTNFTGPVATNERFSFANNPSAHFTEEVTQHETRARFYNDNDPILLAADANGTIDVPIFDRGFQRGYGIIDLAPSIGQNDLKYQALGGGSEPGSNGIYVPNNGTALTGGIYIRGNQGNSSDNPIINMGVGANGPVYTITRGTTTKIITVDYAANQTTIQTQGGGTDTYQGIPDGVGDEGILIYINDDVQSLSGTVQKDTGITVSSERDIVITNHIRYQEYNPSPLSATGYRNVLGILSWGGDVRISTSAPNNLDIHGVVMAHNGIFTVDNYNVGSPRGLATLLGGAITEFYGAFGTFSGGTQQSGYGRNFVYDSRMLQGIAPPYFPYMTNFTAFESGLDSGLTWRDMRL